ncbi:MAG: AzlD domain-containing protein [Clostridia bacterium]|nr:AzlD domain-containing protein [Clostridia bacterium]
MQINSYLLINLAVMALVTYLIRAAALIFIRKKIENKFIKSFLYYIPYAVLAAMTIPAIFSSTGSVYSAILGLAVAVTVAFFEKGLVTVALSACVTVFVTELVLKLI